MINEFGACWYHYLCSAGASRKRGCRCLVQESSGRLGPAPWAPTPTHPAQQLGARRAAAAALDKQAAIKQAGGQLQRLVCAGAGADAGGDHRRKGCHDIALCVRVLCATACL